MMKARLFIVVGFHILWQSSGLVVPQLGTEEVPEEEEGAKCQMEGWGCGPNFADDCCAGLRCDTTRETADTDGTGTCQSTDPPLCMNENILKFEKVDVHSQHGTLTVVDVLPTVEGDPIDLEIVNDGGYEPFDPAMNGLDQSGRFLKMNFKTGTSTTLTFRLVNRNTKEQTNPHGFYFSVFDIDRMSDGGGVESVSLPDAVHWSRDRNSTVATEDGKKFSATAYGAKNNNPDKSPLDMSPDERKAMITFELGATSKWTLKVDISPSTSGEVFGRNLDFAGASGLTCPEGANRHND